MASNKRNILYVDGYNIINSWENLKNLQKESLEEARELLISEMAEYASLSAEEVVVVFDAYRSDSVKETIEKRLGITIVYTKKYQTADTYIEKQMHKLARRHNVRVCTDDAQVQSLAFERGATRITSLELYNDLLNKRLNIKKFNKKRFKANFDKFPLSEELVEKIEKIKKDLLKE
ncbi:MAG: NYN domain-containing protein [Peptoniphilaceae bacterium]|nr:NYN domain-containing protein [Peptoniphilaceae bacterium]MDY6018062.1 NYN domain-containing protein [Anaerococcus sp.]